MLKKLVRATCIGTHICSLYYVKNFRLAYYTKHTTYNIRVLLWELMCRNKAFKLHVHVCLEQEQLVRHQSR